MKNETAQSAKVCIISCKIIYPLNESLTFQEFLPLDIQSQLANSKQHIMMMHTSFSKIRDLIENIVAKHRSNAADMISLGKELK